MPRERTYIMIKPDGVQRGLVGGIVKRFEKKGFKLVAMKSCQPSKEHLETHYADLKSKKFFPGLIEYMLSGPVVCMVWEGLNAVKTGRRMLGETMPSNSAPGSIRGDLCIDVGRNICHGSDSVESANKEIALWFGAELNNYTDHSEGWVYEDEEAKGPILLGMGNPLLDISAEVPSSEFEKWGAKEGNAMLADEGGKHTPMYADLIKNYDVEYIAGGATQNSIRVAAHLGATCSYIGCIGKDDYGAQLKKAVAADNVTALYLEDESAATGTCAVLVKEKERSLIANLAAANNYKPDAHMEQEDVKAAIASAQYYYVSGFFLTVSPPAIMKVATQAAADNKCFCLNLAAPFIAQFFGEPMAAALPYCDIVFGNETEAAAFAEKNGLDDGSACAVAQHIAAMDKVNALRPRVCCITQGAEFTAVSIGGAAALKFPVEPLDKELIVDTNGAGDAFVGGFLSRYVKGATLADCVNTGHATAALIIQESGCKMPAK